MTTNRIEAPHIPDQLNDRGSIFLAGSIEMGKAEPWQAKLVTKLNALDGLELDAYDPRRDDWDSSWEQTIENKQFNEQVSWELEHIEMADLVVVYFDPKTQSPITLAELGLCCGKGSHTVVCCPPGFWRKGNVDILCERYGVPQVDDLDGIVKFVQEFFS